MEAFVLIYAIFTSYGVGTGTAEFVGKEACEQAGAAVVEQMDGAFIKVSFACFPKGGN